MAKRARPRARPRPVVPRSPGNAPGPISSSSGRLAAPTGRRALIAVAIAGAVIVLVAVLAAGGAFDGSPGAMSSPSVSAAGTASAKPAVASGTPTPASSDAASSPAEPAIAGLPCDAADHENDYHVHAHLNIRVDGQLKLPPADVGIRKSCHYWIHTHQPHGVIHVEAPAAGAYTLGQFFDIWGKSLSATQVGDDLVGSGRSLFVFIDRVQVAIADPRSIPLDDLHAIELQIGTAPLAPLPYTFPADLQ